MITVIRPYISLMRLDRPIGICLLLWPTLIALWLASKGVPHLSNFVIFTSGVVLMRSAGCVINDYADRNFDAHVARTKQRPLATNQIAVSRALFLFASLLCIGFLLVLQLKLSAILLSMVAVALTCFYPFAKRFTNYPQIILGIAFAWSIPMAYMQVAGSLTLETWILFISTIAWVVAYDTQYAMADKADDLKLGVKSTAIAFGRYDKFNIFILQSSALLGFIYIGIQRAFSLVYFMCVAIAWLCTIYQQILIKNREPAKCFTAFLHNNYFGVILYIGTILA